jgi:hypothetical protein
MKELKVRYDIRAKIGNREPDCTLDIPLVEIEQACDFDELILDKLENYFSDGKNYCNCYNENQNFCECDPLVDDFEILDRSLINI